MLGKGSGEVGVEVRAGQGRVGFECLHACEVGVAEKLGLKLG